MDSPLETYEYLRKLSKIEDLAKYELFDKYLKLNKRGPEKLQEIDSTDQESKVLNINGGLPIPGSVYTFVYKSNLIEQLTNSSTVYSFVDYAPIVFCFSMDNNSFKGINFNLLPPKHRLYFLETYYNSYRNFFDNILDEKLDNDKIVFNKGFLDSVKSGYGNKLLETFSRMSKTNLKFAYRQYNYRSIKNLRMVEYNEWKYLPFFNPSNSIKKISFDIIYKIYMKSLIKTFE